MRLGGIVSGSSSSRRSLAAQISLICLYFVLAVLFATALVPTSQAAPYAAMVVDGHTGKILYSRKGDALRYPASLTKIMTLYLLFDQLEAGKIKESSRLKVSKRAAAQPPSKLGLKPGQTISVSDAIRALVTKSANDIAVVVAENIAGTEQKFARLMTEKARSIGMKKTVFRNASGLPDKNQVTTARDMITLANRLMFDHPERYAYFSQKYFRYKGKKYRNHNRLLFDYKGTDGIKTGYTRASGFNLLANVKRGNKHLIAVVFGGKTSKRRNATMRAILNKSLPSAIAKLPEKKQIKTRKQTIVADAKPDFPEDAARTATGKTPEAQPAEPYTVASLPARPGAAVQSGGYHIQVGAYARKTDAIERLQAIKNKAGDVIGGYTPLAIPLVEPQRYLYRARFAGFTRNSADNACLLLKKRAITCVVMSAE